MATFSSVFLAASGRLLALGAVGAARGAGGNCAVSVLEGESDILEEIIIIILVKNRLDCAKKQRTCVLWPNFEGQFPTVLSKK